MSNRQLCVMACVFCKTPLFLLWVDHMAKQAGYEVDIAATPADAKEFILKICNITSRNYLDTDPAAAELFHEYVRKPFNDWKEARA